MPRTPSDKMLEAVELIQQGHTPQDLETSGFPHAMAYRAASIVKLGNAGQYTKSAINNRKQEQLNIPQKGDKLITPQGIAVMGGGTQRYDFSETRAKVARWVSYPEFLPKAKLIAKTEFGWPVENYSDPDFLDTILYLFFVERGYPMDAYYKVKDKEELLKLFYADKETGEIKPLVEVSDAANTRDKSSPTNNGGEHNGKGGANNPTGEGVIKEGEAGGDKK